MSKRHDDTGTLPPSPDDAAKALPERKPELGHGLTRADADRGFAIDGDPPELGGGFVPRPRSVWQHERN